MEFGILLYDGADEMDVMGPARVFWALDDVRSAHVGVVGVASLLAKSASLAKQVPGLIQRDLERLVQLTVLVRR